MTTNQSTSTSAAIAMWVTASVLFSLALQATIFAVISFVKWDLTWWDGRDVRFMIVAVVFAGIVGVVAGIATAD